MIFMGILSCGERERALPWIRRRWEVCIMLASLRDATLRELGVEWLSRGLRPLATCCDPFGIETVPHMSRPALIPRGRNTYTTRFLFFIASARLPAGGVSLTSRLHVSNCQKICRPEVSQ